jgi:uncharacterized protein
MMTGKQLANWSAACLLVGCSNAPGVVASKVRASEAAISQSCAGRHDYLSLTGRVVDQAELLSPENEAQLSDKLVALEERTRHQFVIATTPSLQGKPINDYSLCLARHWAIGRKDHNDGVVLLVAPNERKVRIEVGYGLENALRDDEAKQILDQQIIPAFKNGDFAGGIAAGTDAIISEIS